MDHFGRETKRRPIEASQDSEGKGRDCLPNIGLAGQGRQNKISQHHSKERKTFLSLTHEEHEIFGTSLGALPKQGSQKDSRVAEV